MAPGEQGYVAGGEGAVAFELHVRATYDLYKTLQAWRGRESAHLNKSPLEGFQGVHENDEAFFWAVVESTIKCWDLGIIEAGKEDSKKQKGYSSDAFWGVYERYFDQVLLSRTDQRLRGLDLAAAKQAAARMSGRKRKQSSLEGTDDSDSDSGDSGEAQMSARERMQRRMFRRA